MLCFCVGNFSFATVKFLSKISFMMVELIKCLVKWTISSGDSIFFHGCHPSQHQFPEILSNFDKLRIFGGNFRKFLKIFSIWNIPFVLVA